MNDAEANSGGDSGPPSGDAESSGNESSLAGSEQEENNSDEEACSEEQAEQVHQLGAGHKRSMRELRPKKFVFKSGYLAKKRDQLQRKKQAVATETVADQANEAVDTAGPAAADEKKAAEGEAAPVRSASPERCPAATLLKRNLALPKRSNRERTEIHGRIQQILNSVSYDTLLVMEEIIDEQGMRELLRPTEVGPAAPARAMT